jgi:hypothetical protein
MRLLLGAVCFTIMINGNHELISQFKSKLKYIESKYKLNIANSDYYEGDSVLNSECLRICNYCNIDISSIQKIAVKRYFHKDKFIPITIELWVFKNVKMSKTFHNIIKERAIPNTCGFQKTSYSYILKNGVIICISGNPVNQTLLDKLYSEFRDF